jgi:hypothetical protein
VHEPLQSALHLVVQVADVETATHCVVQWSSQHAPQEASQSVDDDADADPSDESDDDELEVHDALQPAEQRVLQSVVQSNMGGLVEHFVVQSVPQVETHVASADVVHMLLHVCSSFAAHASSQLAGAHWVAQSFCKTTEHWALASILILPQSAISARAVWGKARSATNGTAANAQRTQVFVDFMGSRGAIYEPPANHRKMSCCVGQVGRKYVTRRRNLCIHASARVRAEKATCVGVGLPSRPNPHACPNSMIRVIPRGARAFF